MKLYDEVSRLSKKAELKPIEMIKVYHSFGVDQCGYEKFDPPNQKGAIFSCLRNHTKSALQTIASNKKYQTGHQNKNDCVR